MASEAGLSWSYPAFVGGLQDPSTKQYQNRRALFKLVNELRSNGLQGEVDIPQIAVVGSQSVGKSSLIESIAGITLPRAQGTCTRCPIECRLSRSTSPWSCEVYLRLAGQPKEIPFGAPFNDKSEVEERIRRAQLAILNPTRRATDFLGPLGSTGTGMRNDRSFSNDLISVRISGSQEDDLSFVDLPGVISSVRDDGNDKDIEEVKNLVLRVIEKPSCLILLVVSGETDPENQGARRLVSEVDPQRLRTIPVLTKPDRIASGEHDRWLRILTNEQDRYKHGWFCVKQRDQLELEKKISWGDARDNEYNFFAHEYPWNGLDKDSKSRLGTPCLTRALGTKLYELISKSLPRLRREVEEKLLSIKKELEDLPKELIGNPVAIIWNLLDDFKKDVNRLVKGRPEAGAAGFIQTFRKSKEQFRMAIQQQAPVFELFDKPTRDNDHYETRERAVESPCSITHPLDVEINDDNINIGLVGASEAHETNTVVYVNEVLDFITNARTRELPANYPYAVTEHYVALFTKRWPVPATKLLETTEQRFLKELERLVDLHFSKFAPGGLDAVILRTVLEQLKRCGDSTKEKIKQIIALEQEEPVTLNEDIIIDKKREFHAKFKEARRAQTGQLQAILNANTMQEILTFFGKRGLGDITRESLIKALPTDESEDAIEVMSEVCAYYEVAFRRFIDNIPMIIDLELLKGFERTLNEALFRGLGLGDNIQTRCASFLEEDPYITRSREILQGHLERLTSAFTNLHSISTISSESGGNPLAYSPVALDHPDTPQSHASHQMGDSPYQFGTPEIRPALPDDYIPPAEPFSIPNSFSSPYMVPPMDALGFEVEPATQVPPNQKKKKGKKKAFQGVPTKGE
ncbi:hypothetical protein M408DRAFT_327224 [Serendipita vermifera MAFF 305830]|uniref:Dynamin-type G domain-containing protein n=1 Tax=Serendipita vermifera MAFF 305830 TaxID=933852 RepID=A0A0C3BI52_SERVB|nr:hypothetical protein M408DRAFT_327224 [Serendipita vermifera MAFF 305830]